MKVVQIDITELIPCIKNPRKNDNAVDMVASSIKTYGFRSAIVVDEKMEILAGHTRYKAAKKLKLKKVPVHIAEGLTEAEKVGYRIADNKIAEIAEWDMELLENEMHFLQELDFDLSLTGFDDDELEALLFEETEGLTDEDEVPDVPDDPVSKLGDVWLLGDHRLMCGDSTDAGTVALLMNGDKADMVFTDPPYGINESGQRKSRGADKFKASGRVCKGRNYKDFVDDSTEYAEKAFDIIQDMNIPRQVRWGANYYAHHIPQSANWFIWDKRVEEKNHDTQSDCEMAWVKSKWSSVRIFRHLWKGAFKDSEHGQARVHPTQKPVALAEWAFDYFRDVKSVLDLFGGSGSTLIACEKTKRQCYMMELDPHYIDVIIQRWQNFVGKSATLESTGEDYGSQENNSQKEERRKAG